MGLEPVELEPVPQCEGLANGGIFINYRSLDQPVAAAAIHDALARRFGEARVFRDCVSMRPGQHYPSTIRRALERAAILVAVVGPHWLTLTDERTGTRLLDRDDDWVRQEIAFALRHRIAIVPILLKDTPDDARALEPAELPEDIRPFATLQAFPFSQRRFGDDLNRLASYLLRMRPALVVHPVPGAAYEDPHPDPFSELLEALLQEPYVRDPGSRRLLLDLLGAEIATAVPHQSSDRMHVIAMLQTCMRYPDGLVKLIYAVRSLGMDPRRVRHLRALAGELVQSDGHELT